MLVNKYIAHKIGLRTITGVFRANGLFRIPRLFSEVHQTDNHHGSVKLVPYHHTVHRNSIQNSSLGKLHEPKNGVSFEGRTVDAILTIVDKFSNRVHFYAVSSTLSTDDLVQLLLHHHFPLHGLPSFIKSDRGPQFTIAAFRSSLKQLKMESILSLARHQQSNG